MWGSRTGAFFRKERRREEDRERFLISCFQQFRGVACEEGSDAAQRVGGGVSSDRTPAGPPWRPLTGEPRAPWRGLLGKPLYRVPTRLPSAPGVLFQASS